MKVFWTFNKLAATMVNGEMPKMFFRFLADAVLQRKLSTAPSGSINQSSLLPV
jgi:hypothetical protein